MVHQDRTPAGAVALHGMDVVARRLDARDDRAAALPADGVGVGAPARFGGRPRANEGISLSAALEELGELRLAHREPGAVGHGGQPVLQIPLDRVAVVVLGERRMEAAQPLEPCLERGFPFAAAGVPALEVREDRHVTLDGVDGRIVEPGGCRSRRGLRVRAEKPGEVERVDGVGLCGTPARGVGQDLREEVGERVAQRRPDSRGIVVRLDELGERLHALAPEGLPLLPEVHVRADGFVVDLLARPGLEVDRPLRLDALALRDLPGVHPRVVDERLRVEELEGRAGEKVLRPRLVFEKPDRGLVAVEARAHLHRADERLRPFGGILARLRRLQKRVDGAGGLLELLLGDEPVDLFPARGGRRDGAHGRRGGCPSDRDGGRPLLLTRRRPQGDSRDHNSSPSRERAHVRHSANKEPGPCGKFPAASS